MGCSPVIARSKGIPRACWITPEAYVIDGIKRRVPALSTALVGWRWRKISET